MYGNRGFFVSVDSILALLLSFSMFILITNITNDMRFDAWSDNHLQRYSMDLLAVLEKSGQLESSVITNDATSLREVISETSDAMCFLMEVHGDSGIVFSIEKQDCLPTGRRRLITRRSFMVSGDQTDKYTAITYAWYKEV